MQRHEGPTGDRGEEKRQRRTTWWLSATIAVLASVVITMLLARMGVVDLMR